MARREAIAPAKLAFLVEGDTDKAFIETLVPRVLGSSIHLRVVRVGGKAAFPSTFLEAAQFLEAGYTAIFLLVDADTEIPSEVDLDKRRLMEVFRRYGFDDRVRICMAVPMLETWLLAAHREHPERSMHPKRDLARIIGAKPEDRIEALTAELPIDVA